ncbi:uncharacterized protein [Pyrus communis]|uniref:uncharacterized protein n=1 Tax=Pyrus communis TaxID=23211 RepID=UPI0035C1AE62
MHGGEVGFGGCDDRLGKDAEGFLRATPALEPSPQNAFGVMGLLPQQKITATLRMLAYGTSTDQVDEIIRMGKSTILESLMRFYGAIESIYTAEYLWKPTNMDLERLLKNAEMRGFPGMIGSIDCMHWTWKNCSSAWQGAYRDRK